MRDLQSLYVKGQRLLRDRQFKKAEAIFLKISKVAPELTQVLEALGIIALEKGNFPKAKKYLAKAIRTAPSSAELQNLMGTILHADGNSSMALVHFEKSIMFNENYAAAHYNYARSLAETGSIVKANKHFSIYNKQKANDPDAYIVYVKFLLNNSAHQKAQEVLEALESRVPLDVNLLTLRALTLAGLGEWKKSLDNFYNILEQNPNDWMTYKKMGIVLKALESSQSAKKNKPSNLFQQIRSIILDAPELDLLECWLSSYSHLDQNDHFELAVRHFPKPDSKFLNVTPSIQREKNKQVKEPTDIVALLHWGRSGSGFLHSLIDNHPDVVTIPGHYCCGFFEKKVWEHLFSEDLELLVKNFTKLYEVFFNPEGKSPPGVVAGQAVSEGYTEMGHRKNQNLRVEQKIFEKCLVDQLRFRDRVNQSIFFKCVHLAYQQALEKKPYPSHIFYHIHSPTRYALYNYLKHFPKTKLLMTVREPIQNFESWVSAAVEEKKSYEFVVERAAYFLFEFDQKIFERFSSRGIKLEDMKTKTSETMAALCQWMGIQKSDTLFDSSFQGLKWWGDLSTIRFGRTDPVNLFTPDLHDPIRREIGYFLSERDQFVLKTLFYPVRLHFDYLSKENKHFKQDLDEIRKILSEPFDFEKRINDELTLEKIDFKRNASSIFFRNALEKRWETLNLYGTYPQMLNPL